MNAIHSAGSTSRALWPGSTLERCHEREIRVAWRCKAARNWQEAAATARVHVPVARYAGYGVAHWQAAQNSANDNRSAPLPPSPRPRPF